MTRQIFKLGLLFLYFFCVIILLAQAPESSKNPPPETEETPPTRPAVKDIDNLMEQLEKLRELKFTRRIKSSIKTKEELKKKILTDFQESITEEELTNAKKTLVKFGVVPEELDLKKLMIDLLTEQILGFYDSRTKELCLIEMDPNTPPPPGFEGLHLYGIFWQDIVLIHELAHALTDQQFGLDSLRLPSEEEKENDDLVMALRALAEGEATFIQWDYVFRKIGMDLTLMPGVVKHMGEIPATPDTDMPVMEKTPPYIRNSLLFPYTKGFLFIYKVKSEKGWPGVNKLYWRPPSSTEQILHPQKYLDDPPDYPTLIKLPELAKVLPQEDWKVLLKNVMGEFSILLILNQFLPNMKTDWMASGWDGDQYVVLEHKNSQEIMLIWLTTWDSPRDAQQFFQGYSQLINQKYKNARIVNQEENIKSWLDGSNMIFLEVKDKDVLIMETIPEKILKDLSGLIWQETKREELRELKSLGRNRLEAKAHIEELFKKALTRYEMDNGRFPSTEQGLEALCKKPTIPPEPVNWTGPYLKEIPLDPWNNPYKYVCPGIHNPTSYDLSSFGPDAQEGTEDDITNWQEKK